jgi:hypothetical protein
VKSIYLLKNTTMAIKIYKDGNMVFLDHGNNNLQFIPATLLGGQVITRTQGTAGILTTTTLVSVYPLAGDYTRFGYTGPFGDFVDGNGVVFPDQASLLTAIAGFNTGSNNGGTTPPVTTPSSYDTVQTFADQSQVTTNGVTTTLAASNANAKMKFNSIANPSGGPANMIVKVNGVQEAAITFPTDFIGSGFEYTDLSGSPHTSTFTDGTVTF